MLRNRYWSLGEDTENVIQQQNHKNMKTKTSSSFWQYLGQRRVVDLKCDGDLRLNSCIKEVAGLVRVDICVLLLLMQLLLTQGLYSDRGDCWQLLILKNASKKEKYSQLKSKRGFGSKIRF